MFPSPYGDFVFQLFRRENVYHEREKLFPSPYGDFVFQRKRNTSGSSLRIVSFPSPYGDFVFQLLYVLRRVLVTAVVSVPLRGFCFSTNIK